MNSWYLNESNKRSTRQWDESCTCMLKVFLDTSKHQHYCFAYTPPAQALAALHQTEEWQQSSWSCRLCGCLVNVPPVLSGGLIRGQEEDLPGGERMGTCVTGSEFLTSWNVWKGSSCITATSVFFCAGKCCVCNSYLDNLTTGHLKIITCVMTDDSSPINCTCM